MRDDSLAAPWGTVESDPIADIQAAMRQAFDRGLGPPATIHHPKCAVFGGSSLMDCNCGGWAFPART